MQTETLFQLINPLIFALVATALFLLGRVRAELRTINWFAAGFLFAAMAFILDISRDLMPLLPGAIIVDIAYTLACLAISVGLVRRFNAAIPVRALSIILTFHIAGFISFRIIWPDLLMLDISTNFFCGLLFALGSVKSWRFTRRRVERAVNIVFLISAAQLTLRPIIVGQFFTTPDSFEAFTSSAAFVTLHLTTGIFNIAAASTLLTAYVVKLIYLLRRDAETDTLTKLPNRRGFRRYADRLQLQVSPGTEDIFVILADLDRFKNVNDTYGHNFGDQLICVTADLFKCPEHVPCKGARLGGEEFALICLAGSLEEARIRAEKLRAALETTELPTPDGPKTFTASFGVAQLPLNGSMTDALECADEALYIAKKRGRNRVVTQEDVAVSKLQKHVRRDPLPPTASSPANSSSGEHLTNSLCPHLA